MTSRLIVIFITFGLIQNALATEETNGNKGMTCKQATKSTGLFSSATALISKGISKTGDQLIDTASALTTGAESLSNMTTDVLKSATSAETYTMELSNMLDAVTPFVTRATEGVQDSAEYTKIVATETTKELPFAAMRIFTFDLSPSKLINDIVVPLLAISKEYSEDTYSSTTYRSAKVTSQLSVFTMESGLKLVKASVFGVVPGPLDIIRDLAELNSEINRNDESQQSLVNSFLKTIFIHVESSILNENLSHAEKLKQIAELQPLLMQFSEVISKQVDNLKIPKDKDELLEYLELEAENYRIDNFGTLGNKELEEQADQKKFGQIIKDIVPF